MTRLTVDLVGNTLDADLTDDIPSSILSVAFDGHERFGLINEDPDCGDPTLIVWDNEGTALLSIHLGSINFDQDPRAAEEEFWEDVAQSMNP